MEISSSAKIWYNAPLLIMYTRLMFYCALSLSKMKLQKITNYSVNKSPCNDVFYHNMPVKYTYSVQCFKAPQQELNNSENTECSKWCSFNFTFKKWIRLVEKQQRLTFLSFHFSKLLKSIFLIVVLTILPSTIMSF